MVELYIFVLGLLFGSFYNVVGLRLPKEESIVFPGSHCPKCGHKLAWHENIPLISYIFLKGKCKSCKCRISVWYPVIELLTAMLFLISYYVFGISSEFFISIVISSLVVIIFVSDVNYMIILDSPLVISSILICIVRLIFSDYKLAISGLFNGLIIFGIMYLIMLLGNFIFKKESLGGGDIKLSFVAGLALGIKLGIFYIILAAFLAFPYAVYVTIRNKENMLPFGPFLAVSLLVIFLNSNFFVLFINKLLGL